MTSRTGAYVAERRRAKHLSPQQLAAAVGYTNLGKGARRILALERDGNRVAGLLGKVVDVLELDAERVHSLIDEDRRRFEDEWSRWANEPVEPELRFRPFAAMWCRAPMPSGLSRADAVEFARAQAMERHLTYVLVWSRKEEVWCYPEGNTY